MMYRSDGGAIVNLRNKRTNMLKISSESRIVSAEDKVRDLAKNDVSHAYVTISGRSSSLNF